MKKPTTMLDMKSAAYTGWSLRHMLRLISADHVRTIQIGKKFFILRTDLDAWMEKKALQSNDPA